jgi:two-component sensor histidine kinase
VEAALHGAEVERLAALRRYEILDTPREQEFDDIVAVVSAICETPISVINLIDEGRQWFKAEVGLGVRETPLLPSICAHAILQPGLFVVPDTLDDIRFADNPLVTGDPGLRFYAGALLETSEGLPLGTICVLDYMPRTLDQKQKDLLRVMATQIMRLLESRRLVVAERAARNRAEELVRQNEILARETDHRVMNSLALVSSLLSLQARRADPAARVELEDAQRRVHSIAAVHRQLHATGGQPEVETDVFLQRLCNGVKGNAPGHASALTVDADKMVVSFDTASGLGLITAELIANSYKHAFPNGRKGSVTVTFSSKESRWVLSVIDDGIGLPPDFDPNGSTGLGMRVVTSLARRLNATLTTRSDSSNTAFIVAGDAAGLRPA